MLTRLDTAAQAVGAPEADPVFEDLIPVLYRAATGIADWSEPFAVIARELRAWGVHLTVLDRRDALPWVSHLFLPDHPSARLAYLNHYYRLDPRPRLLLDGPTGVWRHCQEAIDEEIVATSPFYQEFLLPNGGRWGSGIKLVDNPDYAAVFAIHRGLKDSPLEAHEIARLDRLRPHLLACAAIEVGIRSRSLFTIAGQSLLESLHHPVFLIDANCQLLRATPPAKKALSEGSILVEREGRLACANPSNEALLTTVVRSIALEQLKDNPEHDGLAAPRALVPVPSNAQLRQAGKTKVKESRRRLLRLQAPDDREVEVLIKIIDPTLAIPADRAQILLLLTLIDPKTTPLVDPRRLQSTLGITAAEAEVAAALAQGDTTAEVAKARGVAVGTVRSQVKSLMAKTGCRRQKDLVRKVFSVAVLA